MQGTLDRVSEWDGAGWVKWVGLGGSETASNMLNYRSELYGVNTLCDTCIQSDSTRVVNGPKCNISPLCFNEHVEAQSRFPS